MDGTIERLRGMKAHKAVSFLVEENKALRERMARLRDLSENVVIAFGMGWDMEGVIDCLRAEMERL